MSCRLDWGFRPRRAIADGGVLWNRIPMKRRARILSSAKALHASLTARLGVREVGAIIAFFISAVLILGFWNIAEEVTEGETHELDTAVLMSFRTPGDQTDLIGPEWVEEMVRDVTALGSYAFIIIVVVSALGYLMLIRKRALGLLMVACVAGGMLLSRGLKAAFDRPRPDIDHAAQVFTASFPSGHATLSAVTFLTLGAILTRVHDNRWVKLYFVAVAVFLTILVGASRVYLGVHYPTDVLAGWCLGSAWAALCWAGALWLQRHGKAEQPAKR